MKSLPNAVTHIVWIKVATSLLYKIHHLMVFVVTGSQERETMNCILVPPLSKKVGISPLKKQSY